MKQLMLSLILLQCCCICIAQNNSPHHHFNLLSIKDGLPEGTVVDLLQDKEDYIWIGTQKGLVRYDGYKPKVYDFGIKDPYGINVRKLYEDRKGRLWVALISGLYRYDRSSDSFIDCNLHWNFILAPYIAEDASGNIWVSAEDSLIHYNTATNTSEFFSSNAKGRYKVNADSFGDIYEDKEQRIWVGSTNGLYEYKPKQNSFIAHLARINAKTQYNIGSVQEDAHQPNILYFIVYTSNLPGSLGKYDLKSDSLTIFHYNAKESGSISSDSIANLYTDFKGRLWITGNKGLSLYNTIEQKFINYSPEPKNAFFYVSDNGSAAIREDKAGNLWFRTQAGLYYFDLDKTQFYRDTANTNFSNGLIGNPINAFIIDRAGIIWFGVAYISQGLQWMDTKRSKFIQYASNATSDVSFKGGTVFSFSKAPDGSIWMSTANGIYHQLLDGSIRQVQTNPGKNNYEKRICCDSKGLVWISLYNNNKSFLYSYNSATGETKDYTSYTASLAGLKNNFLVRLLYIDHSDNLWIGTEGDGLLNFNTSSKIFTKFPFIQNNYSITDTHGALDDNSVLSIYEDTENTLWVGTNLGSLNKFNQDKGTFTTYIGKIPGFNCVNNINEDSKGRLWAGTFFGGLFMLNKNRDSIKRYSEADGLLYDGVWATEEDNERNIWAFTQRGISILNPATGKITNKTGIDNIAYLGSLKANNGNFYFATDNGFVSLNPEDFKPDVHSPVVHLESLHLATFINNKLKDSVIVINASRKYSFKYNENRIIFNYVGLYFKDPLATQYAYKLNGYDEGWVYAGTQRSVTYTNLSSGKYTFYIKAANSDGVWSNGKETVSFTIMPPWWRTWWMYCIYVLSIIAAVYFFVRIRLKRLQLNQQVILKQKEAEQAHAMEEMKSRFFANITHELRTPLTLIISPVQKQLQENSTTYSPALLKGVYQNSQQLLRLINQLLDMSKLEAGNMPVTFSRGNVVLFIEGLINAFKQQAESKNLNLIYQHEDSPNEYLFDSDKLEKIIYNLLSNAFKFTPDGGSITTALSFTELNNEYAVQITVADTGIGISAEHVPNIF